jgi:hypothetical protein
VRRLGLEQDSGTLRDVIEVQIGSVQVGNNVAVGRDDRACISIHIMMKECLVGLRIEDGELMIGNEITIVEVA